MSSEAGGQQQAPERLLVVEDDSYLREEVMRVLKKRTPYQAESAGSGEEALGMADQRHFDLLITDVRMPGIDGIELLERMKKHQPGLLSIVITAFADEEATIRALRIGANDYIRKPFSIRDLVNAIDRQIALLRLRGQTERSQRFLAGVVRSVDAGVLALDEAGRVAAINEAALEILGVDECEALDCEAAGIFDFEGGGMLLELLDELRRKRTRSLERSMTLHQAGLPITYRVSATTVRDGEGRRLGTVLLFNDVSQVIQAQKLQAWKDLARTVAHEIKNPLTPIKLSAQQLLSAGRAGPEALESQLEAAVNSIIKNADRLDHLSREFSRFGRLPQPEMEPLDINDLFDELLQSSRESAGKRRVDVITDFDRDLPRIKGDRESLLRMAANLISNAVDAMPDGGALTISARRGEDGMVELAFADTGVGIAEEVRGRLFHPYVTSKKDGTGLGLVVVKEVVNAHDGDIDVSSAPAEGTVVTVRFPALGEG